MDALLYTFLALNLTLLTASIILYQFANLHGATRSITVVAIMLNSALFILLSTVLVYQRYRHQRN